MLFRLLVRTTRRSQIRLILRLVYFRWFYEVTDPRHALLTLQSTSKPCRPQLGQEV